jgi:hypothetical protein
MSTTPSQNKRNEELNETVIEKLLRDAWENLPLKEKKLITSEVTAKETSQMSRLELYLKELIDEDNRSGRKTPCRKHKGFIEDCGCKK